VGSHHLYPKRHILTRFYSCVAAAKYGPDPTAAVENGILPKAWANAATMAPVKTFVNTPPALYQQTNTNAFAANFNGINSMVCKFDPFCNSTTEKQKCLLL
jgi:hypothetical protein